MGLCLCICASLCYVWVDTSFAVGTSPPLPARAEVTQQWASCCRDQVYPQILPLQPAAAGSASSDLLNLPHFHRACVPPLSSHRSLARIPKPPAASAQPPLGAAGCLEFPVQPDRRGPELWGRRDGKRRKKRAIQSMSWLFIHTTSNDRSGDPLPRDAAERETRGLNGEQHPDTVQQTVSSARRLN